MRNVISNVFKRSTLSFMSLVLAFSTLTPIISSPVAKAATSGPFSVASVCDIDNTVKLNFSLQQTGVTSGPLHYKTPYGNSSQHWLGFGDTDVWSVDTNLTSVPSVSATAEVWYGLKKYTVMTDAMNCSQLNGENFNTVNTPYWGISVGFNVKDFGTATAASVTIERADGTTVTKTANPGVLGLISNATTTTQLTAPFVIQEGAFTEASDTFYWAPAPATTWDSTTTPVKATISVTDQYGTKTAEITNFSQGSPSWPTYESLLPVARTAPPVSPSYSGQVIYSSIPTVLPSNSASLGYAATSTRAFGDKITFAGSDRHLKDVGVNLSSWACESGEWNLGNCVTTPGATFDHPITLNIYNVNNDGTVGSLIASRTQTFAIPYRPTADPTCATPTNWRDTNGSCFNGMNHVVKFDASGIIVPNTVIYSIEYNTQNHGANPIGADGPFNSLNVAVSSTVNVGTNNDTDEVYWDTTYPGYTAGLKADGGWNTTGNPAVVFTATTPATTGGGNNGGGSPAGPTGAGGTRSNAPVFAVADIFGINADEGADEENVAVLGTASNDEGGEVAGATDSKEDKGCGIFLGICWYYWIPIVIAVLVAIYGVRRKLQANS